MPSSNPITEYRIAYARERVSQLETLIAESAGLQSVSVNGTSTTYLDLLKQREYWLNELSRLQGKTSTVLTMRLGGG